MNAQRAGAASQASAARQEKKGADIEALDDRLRIELPAFSGPLDLLLHLITRHELDLLDLPVAFVTERYLAYLAMMQRLDLDIAGEYLVMAATLAHMKSKLLVPRDPNAGEDAEDDAEDDIDPREALVRRLLEYQKYKDAAEQLGGRAVMGRDVFSRGMPAPEAEGPPALAQVSVFALVGALEKVFVRVQGNRALEVTEERISLRDRIREVMDTLRARGRVPFTQLFDEAQTKFDIVITLLAVLEMAKTGLLSLYQADLRSEIYVRSKVEDAPPQGDGLMTETEADDGVGDEGLHDEGLHDEGLHDEGLHDEGLHDEGLHDEALDDNDKHGAEAQQTEERVRAAAGDEVGMEMSRASARGDGA